MSQPEKVSALPLPRGRFSVTAFFDYVFFIFAGVSTIWLAWLVLSESFSWGWWRFAFFVVFWIVLAYLVLPRLHRILTTLYVPDYFIGRARTSDGLLGDPINLALLGSEPQLHGAMHEAGWTRADDVTLASSRRIITSTVLMRSYDEAPVSPLLLFGRPQDVAYQQEVRGNPAKRHHVRFWRCPEGWRLPGGHQVDWLAAGTFDRRVGFSLFTLQVTHKIDANTDIERDHVVSTLTVADEAIDMRVIRDFSTGYHARNGGGDSIITDGDLPVVDLRALPVPPGPVIDEEALAEARANKRPAPILLGSLLMLSRVVAGISTIVTIFLLWNRYLDEAEVDLSGMTTAQADGFRSVVLWILVGAASASVLLYLVLTFLVFRGSNWARITAMTFGSIVIVVSAYDYFDGGTQITLNTNLIGLSFDILVMLALSSQRAREWSRQSRRRRARTHELKRLRRSGQKSPSRQSQPVAGSSR